MSDPLTGKGCETIRAGYNKLPTDIKNEPTPATGEEAKKEPWGLNGALVSGKAPIPVPPSDGIAKNLTIFDGTLNANWTAWDCCGGTNPGDTETSPLVADAEKGDAFQFKVNDNNGTVLGFTTRAELLPDDFAGVSAPFDAAPLVDLNGTFSFDMKVVKDSAASIWILKIESYNGGPNTGDLNLTTSVEGLNPVEGQWQTYTFTLSALQDAGLDLSTLDTFMIFPKWGTGEGAEYLVTNVAIKGDVGGGPQLFAFTDAENPSWVLWDCCGGTTPTVELDADTQSNVAEFSVGEQKAVNGFISREANTDAPAPFDASAILSAGVLQFDLKVVTPPNDSSAVWYLKVESDGNTTSTGDYALSTSNEGQAPVAGEWQTYTFNLADLEAAGLDVSAIDVIMVFPAWGAGEGAVYRLDNVKIYDPTAGGEVVIALYDDAVTGDIVFDSYNPDSAVTATEMAEGERGNVIEVVKTGAVGNWYLNSSETPFDISGYGTASELVFDMFVVSSDTDVELYIKIDSGWPAVSDVVVDTSSLGEWKEVRINLQTLLADGNAFATGFADDTNIVNPFVMEPTGVMTVKFDNIRYVNK
jgi:hypothetical protein